MTIARPDALVAPLAALLLLGGCAYDSVDGYAPDYPPGYDSGMGSGQFVQPGDLFGGQNVASIEVFDAPLAPYGRWVESRFGRAFQPNAPQGWRPYVNGRWGEDRLWISDDPWGWATDHYGRWGFDERTGWVWVPDTQWAPSWTAWREADDVTGWAPIPPGVNYSIGVGFGAGYGYDNWDSWYGPSWVWVPRPYLYQPGFGGGVLPWNHGYDYWRSSRWNYTSGWNGRPGYDHWAGRPGYGSRPPPRPGGYNNGRPGGYGQPGGSNGQPGGNYGGRPGAYGQPGGYGNNRPTGYDNRRPGSYDGRPGGYGQAGGYGANRPGAPNGTARPPGRFEDSRPQHDGDSTRLDQAHPDQARPDQARPDGGRPAYGNQGGGYGRPGGGNPAYGNPGGASAYGRPEGGVSAYGRPEGGRPNYGRPGGGQVYAPPSAPGAAAAPMPERQHGGFGGGFGGGSSGGYRAPPAMAAPPMAGAQPAMPQRMERPPEAHFNAPAPPARSEGQPAAPARSEGQPPPPARSEGQPERRQQGPRSQTLRSD